MAAKFKEIVKEEPAEDKSSNNEDKVKDLATKLGIDTSPDFVAAVSGLGSNEKISEALIEMAVESGKSEAEIAAAMS